MIAFQELAQFPTTIDICFFVGLVAGCEEKKAWKKKDDVFHKSVWEGKINISPNEQMVFWAMATANVDLLIRWLINPPIRGNRRHRQFLRHKIFYLYRSHLLNKKNLPYDSPS